MREPMKSSFAPLLLLVPLASAQVGVQVVDDDGGPGVDFTVLQDAVDAAAPGDVILVRDGSYLEIFTKKPVVIVVEHGSTAVAVGNNGIDTVDAPFAVRGLDFFSQKAFGEVIEMELDQPAFFEDCSVTGAVTGAGFPPNSAVRILGSSQLTLSHCAIAAGDGPTIGLRVEGPSLHAYETFVAGGNGNSASAVDGGDGLFVTGGEIYASGSDFVGGEGDTPFLFGCDAGDGGDGLEFLAGAGVRLLDSAGFGGAGGVAQPGCVDGVPGADLIVPPGQLQILPGSSRALIVTATVVEGSTLQESFQGQPGDLAFLAFSTGIGTLPYLPLIQAPPFPTPPVTIFFRGTVPASGELVFNMPIRPIGLVDRALPLFAQGLFVDTLGQIQASAPSMTVILGAAVGA